MAGKKEPANKRAHPRIDLFTKVKLVDKETQSVQEVIAGNVSKGGMFLRSNRPLPQGKKVALEFEIEEQPVQIDEAEIVWNKPFEPISIDGSLPGMGVRFEKVAENSLQRISRFIDEALTASVLPQQKAPPPAPLTAAADSAISTLPEHAEKIAAASASAAADEIPSLPQAASLKITLKAPGVASAPGEGKKAELPMEQFTEPPPPKKRALIFAIFVLAVAVITFLLLLVLKPFESAEKSQPSLPADVPSPEKAAAPADEKPTAPEKTIAAAEKVLPPPEKPAVEKAVAAAQKPAAPTEKATPSSEKTAAEKAAPAPAKAQVPERKSAEAASAPGGDLLPPEFGKVEKSWKMKLVFPPQSKTAHFTLKSPPRLAIDIAGVRYPSRQRTIESPAPFIQRLRIGVDAEKVRLVLDFSGEAVPPFSVQQTPTGMEVIFPQ